MFEELLSDLGRAFIAGLLTGGTFVAMRGTAVRSVRQYLRAPWRHDSRDCEYVEGRMGEGLAAPGGICVSAAIGGLVPGTIGAEFVDLAAWNRELERRVADQVRELERVSRLKRFLAPQIAELIISSGDEKTLESHRREITVVACDLRGFTAFSETAAPEDVMAVLLEYQSGLGTLVDKFEGTVERFTGDGMMVWFNDPLPCADPCARAARMGIEMRDCVSALADKWRKLDHDLGFAIGMAHGYATLGRIGFERRFDYAAVGMVVNLAARLCGEARDGQILIDSRVRAAVDSFATIEPVGELALKGFNRPVRAFNLMCMQ